MTQTDHAAAREREHWTIDKKVPLAFIFALLVQFVAFVWWASAAASRLSAAEDNIVEIKSQKLDSRVTSLEDQFRAVGLQLNRIEGKIDRVIEREGGRTTHD